MRGLIRAIMTVVLATGLWAATGPIAKADVETLMVPSAAMGRDIPVAFSGGGPHMVVLLDAFDAAPDVSNWVTAGNAMKTLAGKGLSVAAPAGGARDVPPRPLPLRRHPFGIPHPVVHHIQRCDHCRAGAVRRCRYPQHVGIATAGPVEVARPGRARAAAGRQQHPAVGVQPVHSDVQ